MFGTTFSLFKTVAVGRSRENDALVFFPPLSLRGSLISVGVLRTVIYLGCIFFSSYLFRYGQGEGGGVARSVLHDRFPPVVLVKKTHENKQTKTRIMPAIM